MSDKEMIASILMFKVGDRVRYAGSVYLGDEPVEETVIEQFLEGHPGGDISSCPIFNQDMAVVSGVDHWIPASRLTLLRPVIDRPSDVRFIADD